MWLRRLKHHLARTVLAAIEYPFGEKLAGA
jgi:hypothetical protein